MPMLEVKRKYDGSVLYPESDHDDMNLNANLQVSESDVSNTNPVNIVNRKSSVAPAAIPVTVATTAGGTVIAAANANRLSITIQNTGAEPCIIRLGGNPSTSVYNLVLAEDSGTRFGAGGSVTITDFTGEIKGITEANTTIVSILEVVTA